MDDIELIEHSTVDAIVDTLQVAEDEIRRGYDLLEAAQNRLSAVFASQYGFDVCPRDRWTKLGKEGFDHVMPTIRRAAWKAIVNRLGIRPTLSEARWKELSNQLDNGELPELSHDGIRAMVEGVASKLGDYFAEAVDEVFEFLRPHPRWRHGRMEEYKTNTQFEIGRKVILSYAVRAGYGKALYMPAEHTSQKLIALDNVFHLLDGKKRPDGTFYGPLCDAIQSTEDGKGATDYFRFKCFGNGNLHLEFLRADLVAELNKMAGGRRLKGERDNANE